MIFYVKYMVSLRCKMVVKQLLLDVGLHYVVVDLGSIEVLEDINPRQREQLRIGLKKSGLELMDDNLSILVENIKIVIIEMIHYQEDDLQINYSDYISKKLGYNYTYLANIFSEVKGTTIQQFIILNKIERVKELILYDELSLKEIAFKMNYNSLSHLSKQFKKITGLTCSFYKELAYKRRRNLEDL